jgi:hypothetical protein
MMKSMKKLLLMAAIAVMVVSLAAPAMAEEVQDPQNHPSGGSGIVEAESKEEEPGGGVPADDEPICMIPEGCDTADDDEPICMIPEGCDTDEKPYKDPGIRKCDLVPPYCQDNEDSGDDHGHNSGAHAVADDPNSPVEEEEASAPGGMKAGEVAGGITKTAPENDASAPQVVSLPEEAGQLANSSPDVYGCPYDYEYDEEYDVCAPTEDSFGFAPVLAGDKPWPDTVGGNVELVGDFASDTLITVGTGLQIGVGYYVEEGLVKYGEALPGPIGWPFQGLGYTLGFAADVSGTILQGAGEILSSVNEGVGDAIDAVGDAAEDAWDEVSSWF